jgi:hypothetical protein
MDPNTLLMYMSIIGPYLESQPYVSAFSQAWKDSDTVSETNIKKETI